MIAARRRRRLASDRRGTTIIEFAILAPTMMIVLMGLGDLLYQSYVQSLLNGAMQKAARDSAIQGGAQQTAALDARVIAMVTPIAHNSTYTSTRKSYSNFTSIAPEPFTDTNHNGRRDAGECFTDVNGNGVWDADPGLSGQGGANDAVVYTLTVTYPRIFPVATFIGLPATQTISSTTILKNQPYASQTIPVARTICT